MAVTSQDVANQALQDIGDNTPPVTGQSPTWDSSPAGVALQKLYIPTVQTVQRQWQWDASRNAVALTLTGNSPPMPFWLYEYLYPTNGIEVWQLLPQTLIDPNNPLPQTWDIGNNIVSGTQTKVIWTNLASALAVYNNSPSEATWDPLFREAVERLLASRLAMALFGRPDTAQANLESGSAFEQLGETRPD